MRVQVWVPEDLRYRMWAYSDINWSAVAQAAFKEKLAQVLATKKSDGLPLTNRGKHWLRRTL